MENITFAMDDLKCERCGTTCKTKNIYDKHVATCDYEDDEPYQMPVAKTRTANELFNMYIPDTASECGSNTDYICECGKSFGRKFNWDRHAVNCKFMKAKTQTKTDEQTKSNEQIISELRAELADKNNSIAKIRAEKDNEIYILNRMIDFLKGGNNTTIAITPAMLPTAVTQVVTEVVVANKKKKFDPYDFLNDNLETAMDRNVFADSITITEDDLEPEVIDGNPVDWFCKILDRNLNDTVSNAQLRPFHVIRDHHAKQSILYIKKYENGAHEWLDDEASMDHFLRRCRVALQRFVFNLYNEEKQMQTERDKAYYFPEKDEDGDWITKDWTRHTPNNSVIEHLWNMRTIITGLSDSNKNVLKHLKEKYTLSSSDAI